MWPYIHAHGVALVKLITNIWIHGSNFNHWSVNCRHLDRETERLFALYSIDIDKCMFI